jgi:hypothetical protein
VNEFRFNGKAGAKVAIQSVHRCIENQVAVGTPFQMVLNLGFHGLREPTF